MNIRRYYIPDAIYFITSVTKNREMIFKNTKNIDLFWNILHKVNKYYPHELQSYVLLPDHFHFLIKPIDCSFSKLFQSLHKNFTLNYKELYSIKTNLQLWQHRFWDHVIRNERDWQFHLNYIHYNPVKLGCVSKPEEWVNSSFKIWVQRGAYSIGWGYKELEDLKRTNFE